MKRTLHLITSFLVTITFITHSAIAQKEANTWYFGNFAGIDFNSGTPVAISNSAMLANEGCATISDKNTGEILLYTNGATVWNANHQVMDNGTGLTANASSAQAAVIVPDPGNTDQYYIFTAGEYFSNGSDGYRYSIVDLSQNGGLGAVTSVKNVLLYSPACEKLSVVKNSTGTGYWIATHQWAGSNFVCYELTAAGISAPVISSAGTAYNNYTPIGCMKFSSDGTRLATVLSGLDQVEVYDFDASTGEFSNAINIGPVTNAVPYVYGIAFSPNGKRLYVNEENNNGLFQFDLDAGTIAAILASKTMVGTTIGWAMQTMQLGPDGKLYVSQSGLQYLAVVSDPDSIGVDCNFVSDGFYLGSATCVYGLPGFTENVFSTTSVQQVNISSSDNGICEKFCIDFFDLSSNNPDSWQWEFPAGIPATSTDQHPTNICYPIPGTYNVTLITSNSNGSDTLTLINYITVYATPAFPTITQTGNTLTSSPAAAYQWQLNAVDIPGATNQSFTMTQSGFYTVIVFDVNGCKDSANDNFLITGLEEVVAGTNVFIYPNPSSGIFTVELFSQQVGGDISIVVVNALGQKIFIVNDKISYAVWKREINFLADATCGLTSGTYFIEVKMENGMVRKKLLISK